MSWRLVSYGADGAERAGLEGEGEVYDVAAASGGELPAAPAELLAGEGWDAALAAIELGAAEPVAGEPVRGAPQPRPSKILAVGLNYAEHSEESGAETPERPLLFAKWPSAIVGPDATVTLPPASAQVDYEAELAVVIGRRASGVPVKSALAHVGGYTIANDVSARDVQFRDVQWTLGKSFDGFCPLGPAIVSAATLPDPQAVAIEAVVNGELRQSASTAEMVFGVAELIAYISAHVTLLPGDLILTGTPSGVGLGFDPPRWLADGDEVVCRIAGVGELRTRFRAGGAG